MMTVKLNHFDLRDALQPTIDDYVLFKRHSIGGHREYIACMCDNRVVGILSYNMHSIWQENSFGLAMVEVIPSHRNQGVAKQLIAHFFSICDENSVDVVITKFETMGDLYICKFIESYAATHKILFL
jgi:GNAT superfamily N-acetyltransferase